LIRRYKSESRFLSHIKNLVESYDNVAVMTAVDAKDGVFELQFPDGLKNDVWNMMEGIKAETEIREL